MRINQLIIQKTFFLPIYKETLETLQEISAICYMAHLGMRGLLVHVNGKIS